MLLAAATSSQLLNLPVLQLPCPVSCTCCEGPTGPTSGIRRYSFVATSKIISIAFSSACYSCNIATVRSERHDGSTAAARSLPGWRAKVVDGLWGGGKNSCREPFSQLRRVNGARPLPATSCCSRTIQGRQDPGSWHAARRAACTGTAGRRSRRTRRSRWMRWQGAPFTVAQRRSRSDS